jgi:hypothetical protein
VNENSKPKIEHFMKCQVDLVLRCEYLRLEASLGGAGWHRLMTGD